MKKIDITEHVIALRQEVKHQEEQELSTMKLPQWMQQAFDEYYNEKDGQAVESSNIVHVNFAASELAIPKTLAASSLASQQQAWYDQGIIAFKDSNGALLNLIFNKASDSGNIDITLTVSDGESVFLKNHANQSDIHCSLFDNEVLLATLLATVNHDGTFLFAEGEVIEDYEPKESNDCIHLRLDPS